MFGILISYDTVIILEKLSSCNCRMDDVQNNLYIRLFDAVISIMIFYGPFPSHFIPFRFHLGPFDPLRSFLVFRRTLLQQETIKTG